MEYKQFFSQRIYELRKRRGLSQKELGDAVGLSHKSISTIESGLSSTSIEKLILLADFFGVSTGYLLGRREVPNPHRAGKSSHPGNQPDRTG